MAGEFVLTKTFLEEYEGKQPKWGPVGYVTYKRCVTTNTPILTSDLRWVPAGDIKVGTEILAFEEYGEKSQYGREKRRKFIKATITHNKTELARCVRITLSDGSILECTPDHSWLVTKAGNKLVWNETQELLRGNTRNCFFQKYFDLWKEDKSYEAGFLSAAFDGKGSLDRHRGLVFTQVNNPMLSKVKEYLDKFGFTYKISLKKLVEGNQQCYSLRITGHDQVLKFLGMFRPPRLLVKYLESTDKIQLKKQKFRHKEELTVLSLEDIGEREIAVISTSSKTHFTGGFPSHNTYARPFYTEDGDVERTEEWWETVRRVVEGTYTIQKTHCKKLRLPWNDNKAQKSAQEMFRLIFEMKFLPPGRGLWMMGAPYVMEKGGAALNNCFSGDTKFFAHDALMTFKDAAEAGEVKVRCWDGVNRSAMVQSFGKQKTQAVRFKPFGLRTNFQLEYVVTPNHEWILEDGSRTTSLKLGDKVLVKPEKAIPDPSEQIMHLWSKEYLHGFAHGLIFGDGTRHTYYPERHFIRLCGSKNTKYTKMLEQIEGYVSTTSPESYNGDQVVTIKCSKNLKRLPEDTDPRQYRQGFLDGWIAADGGDKSSGSKVLNSQNHEAIDWVIERAPLLGYCITGDNYDSVMQTNLGVRSAPVRRLSLSREPTRYEVKEIHELEEQEVFCVTEDKTHSFTLAGGLPTGNCAFVSTKQISTDFSEPFCFLMDMSMLGVGVGGDTKGAGTLKIRDPYKGEDTHVVPDTREGWVDVVRRILDAYVGMGTLPKIIDYSGVRPYGTPIKGFGGTASGPGPLISLCGQGHEGTVSSDIKDILEPLIGEGITSEAIVDIFNAIGRCVVSGNVRRSAEIMFGESDDTSFLELKDPEKNMDMLGKWRWASNNSIFAQVGQDYAKVAERTAKNGEPGYLWLKTAQEYGRLIDPPNFKDMLAEGANPCSEQTLESYELCCLVETFPARHETYEEYERTLKFAYLYAKTVTLLPTHNERTNAVLLRNRRIGTSQSGIVQSFARHGVRRHFQMCDRGYKYLRSLDRLYSRWLCVPESIKITSVKPSGTVSLLPGATPGVHFPYGEYYWRTMRMDSGSVLLKSIRKAGYRIEVDEGTPNTSIVYFPVREENYYKSNEDVSMWEQLEIAAQMQAYWADNQVSVTVTFKKDEAKDIQKALEYYETRLKSVSFLPLETAEEMQKKGYKHPPLQKITKEEYEEAIKKLKPINLKSATETEGFANKYCDNDVCELPSRLKEIADETS